MSSDNPSPEVTNEATPIQTGNTLSPDVVENTYTSSDVDTQDNSDDPSPEVADETTPLQTSGSGMNEKPLLSWGSVEERANEATPLIASKQSISKTGDDDTPEESSESSDKKTALFLFLEAKTPDGLIYEKFTIFLIILSVVSFVLSSLFLPEYNPSPMAAKCGKWCDAIWFGNFSDNALAGLGIGATSILEIFIVGVFSIDYVLRLYTADLLDPKFEGFVGRLRFVPTFFSLVDLASTVPFYVDAFLLPNTDLAASNFLRMFRLLRMMKVEGRYDLALGLVDDVFNEQKGILGTALFVGITVWGVLSSFFYIAERKNNDMIYCGAAPDRCFELQDDIDTSLCVIDDWGVVDCSAAGCGNEQGEEVCWNLYRSIVESSFWTLMELFGEFPLVDQHSACGKVVGTFTAVVAVAVFALPAGIFGSGFEDQISRRRELKAEDVDVIKVEDEDDIVHGTNSDWQLVDVIGDESTLRGRLYNFLHLQNTSSAVAFDWIINILVVGNALTFMFGTITETYVTNIFHTFEFLVVIVFSVEYVARVYSAGEDPRYRGLNGRLSYACSFLAMVDLLSVLPFWLEVVFTHRIIPPSSDKSAVTTLVKFFRLLRILRFEKYTAAFTTFDDVIRENLDVLGVTGFSAVLIWILFSAILYYTERDNPDDEIANYYKTVPHAMWITLLNLSGECPLAHYSALGKVVVGIIGLFATAIFGVPIGILGAGFEELVTSENDDTVDQDGDYNTQKLGTGLDFANDFQGSCFEFVNGVGSKTAVFFELSIYALIMTTVAIGIIQTVTGYEDFLHQIEWIAAIVFTIEYIIRFIGAGADPEFANEGGVWSRIKFLFSLYSIIDLLAIVPFYLAIAMPGSWVDNHDEYLRMLRLLRLLKLDKYVPSISLIDDVLRLKKKPLIVSCFAAISLWILFAGLMYLTEYQDHSMEIDNLPLYGCDENCTMSDRYNDFFNSVPLTGIHLTGDFPMVEYDGYGRIVCFFMVIAAIGVVSIPSGLIASGFAEIVQSKVTSRAGGEDTVGARNAGDDWFDIRYHELEGQDPPLSVWGPRVDALQTSVNEYLNGKIDERSGVVVRTQFSQFGRIFFFSLIIANVIAVIMESIPEIDRSVGNEEGNFFDVFEAWSVFFFTLEYVLRLIGARKSRAALYSPWVYATTFFGLVDLISVAPWYIQQILAHFGKLNGDEARIFRIVRIFRVLQLEDFVVAFSKLDNVFRASKDVMKATGLMAIIIWVGSSALFFLFEENNPNFRECDASIPLTSDDDGKPGCYDFTSTAECNEYYPGMCSQAAFTNMPNTMFYVAVFLGGDWGFVDFTWQGKLVCILLCVAGIAIYAIPVGTLFDSFGAVLGLGGDDEEEGDEEEP